MCRVKVKPLNRHTSAHTLSLAYTRTHHSSLTYTHTHHSSLTTNEQQRHTHTHTHTQALSQADSPCQPCRQLRERRQGRGSWYQDRCTQKEESQSVETPPTRLQISGLGLEILFSMFWHLVKSNSRQCVVQVLQSVKMPRHLKRYRGDGWS